MTQSGLGVPLSILMSLAVYAGSAQLASLPLLASGAPMWVIWASVVAVELAHHARLPGLAEGGELRGEVDAGGWRVVRHGHGFFVCGCRQSVLTRCPPSTGITAPVMYDDASEASSSSGPSSSASRPTRCCGMRDTIAWPTGERSRSRLRSVSK